MKLDIIKVTAGLILILGLCMCIGSGTETTWRHSGFELWGYDINFTDHNASNIHLLDADYLYGDCSNVTNLNASHISIGEIPLAQIPNTLTGKDADTLDGYHATALLGGNSSSGSYTGNDAVNRAIPHGLGVVPIYIAFTDDNTITSRWHIHPPVAAIRAVIAASEYGQSVTVPDVTNFYVGNAASYSESANANTDVYYWVAFA